MHHPSMTFQELLEENAVLKKRIRELEISGAEHKQAEEALQASESRYRAIFETTGTTMLIVEEDMTISLANSGFESLTGYTREEIEGKKKWIEFVEKNDLEKMITRHQSRRADPALTLKSYEFKLVHRDGHIKNILLTVDMIPGTKKSVASLLDITSRKRAEEQLRDTETRYRLLFEHSPYGVVIIDPATTRILEFNKTAHRQLEYSREEFAGLSVSDIEVDETPEETKLHIANVMKRGRRDFETRHKTRNGEIRNVHVTAQIIEFSGKHYFHGIWRDITELKRSEEALRESERKYRFLTESMTDIVWTTDLNFGVTYVSPSIEKILGFTPEERMLQNVEDTMTKESYDTAVNFLFRELEKERSGTADPDRFALMQTEYYHKQGHTVWVESMVRFIRDHEGNAVGIHGLSRDITERRRAEEEREKLKEQLSRSQKLESIGTLAGGIAHDFNNLLMGIQGNASLMMLELNPSDPNHDRLKQIEEQVKSGADLTRQLMGFARGGRYKMMPTDINEIIEKTAVMFGRTKKEITIYKKYGKDLRAVEVDHTQMGQVFMNLFVNAWQAMHGGGEIFLGTDNIPLDEATATRLALSPGKYVRITVSDTGTGMDAKTLERIFDPFFTTKGMGRGTGLGLATVYGIIKGHRGGIHVTSKPGEGTTFEIYLPITEKAVVGERAAQTETLRGIETILLVDDEAVVLDVTKNMLQFLGYRVLCAGSSQEAVAIFHEKKSEIDLVILDMIMPGMSGFETFDRLRKIDPKMKVLLSSGYSIEGMAQELIEKGCNGFLQKPFQVEDLSQKVRGILDITKGGGSETRGSCA